MSPPKRILILGGTTEARLLAGRLAAAPACDVTLSLAGRTAKPVDQGVPTRVGGFGGAEGLARHLGETAADLLIDATHPFAARISANAVEAARLSGVPLLAFRRPEWRPGPGDRWREHDDIPAALAALGKTPTCVFVALGRQEVAALEAAPQHRYVVRSVDPVAPAPALPQARFILDRGPFSQGGELRLFREHTVEAVLAKNSGGAASAAKLAAARLLGLPVHLVRRPLAAGPAFETLEALEAAVHDHFAGPTERGE